MADFGQRRAVVFFDLDKVNAVRIFGAAVDFFHRFFAQQAVFDHQLERNKERIVQDFGNIRRMVSRRIGFSARAEQNLINHPAEKLMHPFGAAAVRRADSAVFFAADGRHAGPRQPHCHFLVQCPVAFGDQQLAFLPFVLQAAAQAGPENCVVGVVAAGKQ